MGTICEPVWVLHVAISNHVGPCGHLYSVTCALTWTRTQGRQLDMECPTCRRIFKLNKLVKIRGLPDRNPCIINEEVPLAPLVEPMVIQISDDEAEDSGMATDAESDESEYEL